MSRHHCSVSREFHDAKVRELTAELEKVRKERDALGEENSAKRLEITNHASAVAYWKSRSEAATQANVELIHEVGKLRQELEDRKQRDGDNYFHKVQSHLEIQSLRELILRIKKTAVGSKYHAVGACCYCQHIEQLIHSQFPSLAENNDAATAQKVGMFVGDVWVDDLRNAP